ncbi:MAG: hypothetical protein EOM03_18370 [Clostridia bacterium]|nr:hypothetical protein [Clostridia bacterium]
MAKAREIQARTAAALKDPVSLGLDPHQAMAAYNDVMHGMYDKAVSVGAMTPDEAKTVQHAFGGLGGMLGMGMDDVTTDYEASVSAIESGLMDPTTGKLTAKGWMNVASRVLGMLAGPLSSIGLSMAGIPGAIAGALAPAVANAYASPKSTNAIDAATGMASKVTGIDMSPFGAGLAYANTMNTMGKAQQYAGTAPSRPERTSYEGGDSASGIDESFMARYDKFISAPTGNNAAVNPAFQSKFDNRGATVKNNATKQPVQSVQQQQRVTGFNPLTYNKFYTAGV